MQFTSYQTEGFYDEMFQADGSARPHFQLVQEIIQSLSDGQLLRYKHAAERLRSAVHDLPSQYIEAAFPSCVSP